MTVSDTKWMSPQELYDDPKRFTGTLTTCIDPKYPIVPLKMANSVHSLMTAIFPDWPKKLDEWVRQQIADGMFVWAKERLVGFVSPSDSNIAYMVYMEGFLLKTE